MDQELQHILGSDETILWTGKPRLLPWLLDRISVSILFTLFGAAMIGLGYLLLDSPNGGMQSFSIVAGVGAILLIIALGGLIREFLLWRRMTYALSNRRIIVQSGIVGRDFVTTDYDQLTDISVNINVTDKLCGGNTGSLMFATASGTSATAQTAGYTTNQFTHIPDPYTVFNYFKKTAYDTKSDMYFPNALRPDTNPGYTTKYEPATPTNESDSPIAQPK